MGGPGRLEQPCQAAQNCTLRCRVDLTRAGHVTKLRKCMMGQYTGEVMGARCVAWDGYEFGTRSARKTVKVVQP